MYQRRYMPFSWIKAALLYNVENENTLVPRAFHGTLMGCVESQDRFLRSHRKFSELVFRRTIRLGMLVKVII